MADITETPQPQEGQGGAGDAPYAEYLSRIPEEHRGLVEPVFKEWDANTTRKFQEASEYRKQWEPYDSLGVTNVDPDVLRELITFNNDILSNPDALKEWYREFGQANQLLDETPSTTEQGVREELADQGYSPAQIEGLLNEKLAPIQQWMAQQEQQAELFKSSQAIDERLAKLREEHGEFDTDLVLKIASNYADTHGPDSVLKAFEDVQAWEASIEKKLIKDKQSAPEAPEKGGAAATALEQPGTMDDARRQVEERLRQLKQQ